MVLLRYWAPLAAYCGAIFLLSAQQVAVPPPLALPHVDKVAHLFEYALLGWLALGAFLPGTAGLLSAGEAVAAAVLFAAFYGGLDEVHQSYVPGRELDFADLFADVTGAAVAALVAVRWHARNLNTHPREIPR